MIRPLRPQIIRVILVVVAVVIASKSLYANDIPKRIVSLNGAITETLDALGLGKNIVAVDVTSEWPSYVAKLPRVSKNRSISAEGVTAFRPDMIIAIEGDVSEAIIKQWKAVGIKVATVRQQYSVKGAGDFIRHVATAVGLKSQGETLARKTETDCSTILHSIKQNMKKKPKVLFIYARGTGTMSVAGKGSNMSAIIELAGGINAIQEFNRFKPYSTEALVKANPDIIVMFDFGLNSLGGKEALIRMPGVAVTNAGVNGRILSVNGPLMINFGTRLPEAMRTLHRQINPN